MMRLLSPKRKKMAVAFTALFTSAGIAWASCGGTEGLVVSSVGQMTSSVVRSLSTATAKIVMKDNEETEQFISALKVVTKQVQLSSDKKAASSVEVEQANAAVVKEIADKELVDKVVLDFMSQGFDPCGQSKITKKLALAEVTARQGAAERTRSEVEGTGGRYGDVAEAIRGREEQHQKLFCTQEEVNAGLCSSVGKIPGGDSNAALLFSRDKSPEAIAAKNAVINNIIGLPDNPLPSGAVGTPEGDAYLLEKKKKDAFMGFAAYSLKSIQTDNEQYRDVLDERIGQYFGTARATEWAKSQASQAPRGILVDLLKIQGLNVKLRERRLREGLRMEANVAALLELENQALNGGKTQAAMARASTNEAVLKVK